MADAVKILVYRNGRRTLEDMSQASLPANIPAGYLAEVKADTVISDSVTKRHSHSNSTILSQIQEALTTALKSLYDAAYSHSTSSHAPVDAQKNSDITKAEIEAKLTGEISSHSHAGGGGLTHAQVLTRNFIGC